MQIERNKKKILIEQIESQEELDQGIRWISVEGADYNLESAEIIQWLAKYGSFKTNLSEKLHPDCDPESDPIGTGIYTIKMELWGPIPQHLPMFGRKVKIFHKGIQIQCHRCYENHSIRTCRNDKVNWIEYKRHSSPSLYSCLFIWDN